MNDKKNPLTQNDDKEVSWENLFEHTEMLELGKSVSESAGRVSGKTCFPQVGPNPSELSMKEEYTFRTYEPACPPHDQEFIDTIPYGYEIEQIRIHHRNLYIFFAGSLARLIELGKAYSKWMKDLEFIQNSHFEQIENPYSFEYVCHMYTGDDHITMQQAYERGILVEGSHPYHWRYSNKLAGIVFLDYNQNTVWKLTKQITGISLPADIKPLRLADYEFLFDDSLTKGTEGSRLDILKGRSAYQTTGKTLFAMSTGMILNDVHVGYSRTFEEQPKEVTPTVRGNSRQKLIDNGKRSWPAAKQRKGHR